jgi:FkbM family methyltransferase
MTARDAMDSLLDRVARRLRAHLLRDPFLLALQRWHRDRGDETLRLEFPLTSDSLVFDIGGFHGAWAHEIHRRYRCRIDIFEPMPRCVEALRARFAGEAKIRIFPWALSDASGPVTFYDCAEGSGAFVRRGAAEIRCEKKDVAEVLAAASGDIDLVKINIEGGEYQLLPALLRNGIERIRCLVIQFHNFIPDAEGRRREIRERLSRTHHEQWCYPFVWESWVRK